MHKTAPQSLKGALPFYLVKAVIPIEPESDSEKRPKKRKPSHVSYWEFWERKDEEERQFALVEIPLEEVYLPKERFQILKTLALGAKFGALTVAEVVERVQLSPETVREHLSFFLSVQLVLERQSRWAMQSFNVRARALDTLFHSWARRYDEDEDLPRRYRIREDFPISVPIEEVFKSRERVDILKAIPVYGVTDSSLLAKNLEINRKKVRQHLDFFVQNNIIVEEGKMGKYRVYRARGENLKVRDIKTLFAIWANPFFTRTILSNFLVPNTNMIT